jgi:cytoskeletal protein RodZ
MERSHYGTDLRQARERRGLALCDVARTIRVPEPILRHIEAGALGGELPAPVYVRGFIRAYARCVHVAEDGPLRLFDEATHAIRRAAEVAAATPMPRAADEAVGPPHELEPRANQRVGLAVFVVIVLVIATITMSFFVRRPAPSGAELSMDVPATPNGSRLNGAAAS